LHPYIIIKIKGVFSTLQDRKTNKTEKGKEPRSLNDWDKEHDMFPVAKV
jgi:hypothetical protein